ncbi:MAG: CocE/NonD family hydrolase [Candidatus Poribacteria bacterium]|nr:CocE/NonD family hydrolase [Candidatus Poribacteria bacterium]
MIPFPPKDGVRFIKNLMIPMSDGVRLAMDMHVPAGEDWGQTPRPLILEYIPYRKDDTAPYSGYHNYFAQHGFIGARLDCRGTGSSEGINTDEYTEGEQRDGVEAIEWLARQPWCSGKIAMFGASYGGFTSVQIAALRPPHLTTIIPMYFTDDRYTDDCHYRGGALRCYYDIGAYGCSMIGMNAMPPYPEYSGDDWARIWEEHLEHNTPYLLKWLDHQIDGAYWRPGSLRGRYDQIQCSVFMIGGWRDGYPNPPVRTFENLTVPKKVLIGPWNHSRPDGAIPGPRIDYLREVVRWCDYWLKGEDNGVMDEPPICVYMQTYDEPHADRTETSGYWRVEASFSPADSTEKTYWIGEDAQLVSTPATPTQPYDEYDYRPTVGVTGGLWSGGVPFGLPTDQRPDEIHALNYTTASLDEPLEILGAPKVVLHVSSTAPVMAFVARLCDVVPDGTSALVCAGVLNATRRESLTEPSPLAPEAIYELTFNLDCTAWRFEPGHRIRLSICSADFPNLWPTPYPGDNRVYRDVDRPSRLILPVVPLRESENGTLPVHEATFEPSKMPTDVYQLSPDARPWEIVHDVLGDRTGLRTHTRGTSRVSPTTEVTTDAQLEVWAHNRDPADVAAIGKHHRQIARNDGEITVDTCCRFRSTDTAFHVTIDLHITVNDLSHHQQRWVHTFPRVLL